MFSISQNWIKNWLYIQKGKKKKKKDLDRKDSIKMKQRLKIKPGLTEQ